MFNSLARTGCQLNNALCVIVSCVSLAFHWIKLHGKGDELEHFEAYVFCMYGSRSRSKIS